MPDLPLALAIPIMGLIGLMVGSFLNVLIYRLPRMMQRESENYLAEARGEPLPHPGRFNLFLPRSACPHCGHRLHAVENIPILSYLFLKRRCSQCQASIHWSYPVVEGLTALLSMLIMWRFGWTMLGAAVLIFTYLCIALSFIDWDTQLLPDDLTYPLLWLGLLINLIGAFAPYIVLRDAVIGAVAGYLALWSVYWLFKLITGKEGMGYGDFKLLAAIGAWVGWQSLPLVILIASLVGTLIGLYLIIFAQHNRHHPIPFGPYLVLGGAVVVFDHHTWISVYLPFFN